MAAYNAKKSTMLRHFHSSRVDAEMSKDHSYLIVAWCNDNLQLIETDRLLGTFQFSDAQMTIYCIHISFVDTNSIQCLKKTLKLQGFGVFSKALARFHLCSIICNMMYGTHQAFSVRLVAATVTRPTILTVPG